LSIAKEMVQLLGGKIGVASEPDRGSLFHFNVPVKISQSALTS